MSSNAAGLDSKRFTISTRELTLDTSVVAIEGELDLSAAPSLKWTLFDLIESAPTQLVVDLSSTSFMDSTALGVLLAFKRRFAREGGLAIVCARSNVLKIFEFAGVDGAFAIFPSIDQALAYLQGSAGEIS